jgi:hypothetical protein
MTASVQPTRPFTPSLVADLDHLAEQLRGQADPNTEPAVPLPGGDPALLEASADAATLLARLLAAILAFDNGEETTAEDLIQGTGVLMHGIRANTGV